MKRWTLLLSAIALACPLVALGANLLSNALYPLPPADVYINPLSTPAGPLAPLLYVISSIGWVMGAPLSFVATLLGLAYAARRQGYRWVAAIGGSTVLAIVASCAYIYSPMVSYSTISAFVLFALAPLLTLVSVFRLDAHSAVSTRALRRTSPRTSPNSRRHDRMVISDNVDAVEAGIVNIALLAGPSVSATARDLAHAHFAKRYGAAHVQLVQPDLPGDTITTWCDVFVPLIGPATSQTLQLLLPSQEIPSDERSFLEQTLIAQQRGKLLIPVLVDGATMPRPFELPERYRFIARRNATTLTDDESADRFLKPLARDIKAQLGGRRPDRLALWGLPGAVVWLFGALLYTVFTVMPSLARISSALDFSAIYRFLLIALAPLPLLVLYVGVRMVMQRLWERLAVLALLVLIATLVAAYVINAVPYANLNDPGAVSFVVTTALAIAVPLLLLIAAVYSYARGDATLSTPLMVLRRRERPKTELSPARASQRNMGHYFLSYRRADTGAECDRLYRNLTRFGTRYRAFRDLNTIRAGADFVSVLNEALDNCSAVLALIGPDWLMAGDAGGIPRLFMPDDFVRQELATAFKKDKPIIPLLIRGATLPREEDLPTDLAPLAHLTPVRYISRPTRSVASLDAYLRTALHLPPMRLAVLNGLTMWTAMLDMVWLLIHPWLLFTAAFAAVHTIMPTRNCQTMGSLCAYSHADLITLVVLFGLQALVVALIVSVWFQYLRYLLQEQWISRAVTSTAQMLLTAAGVITFIALWLANGAMPTLGEMGAYLFAVAALLAQALTLGFQVHGLRMPTLQMQSQRTS